MGDSAEKVRFDSPDVLRGITIILIVLTHIVLLTNTGSEEGRGQPLPLQILYLGLMSFFLMSGYFYRPGRSAVENIKKRAVQLVIALVICSVALPIITYVWLAICGQPSDISDILGAFLKSMNLTNLFQTEVMNPTYIPCCTCVGYYFPWGMMGGFILFYIIADHVMDDYRKIAVALAALLGVTAVVILTGDIKLPFHFQMAPITASFMLAGACLAKFKVLERVESLEWRSCRYWFPLIVSAAVGIGLCVILPPGVKFDYMVFGDYGAWSLIPYFIEAVCMFVVYLYLAKLFSRLPVLPRLFEVAGQHSLGILLLHGFIATMILAPFFVIPTTSWFPEELSFIQRIITALVTLIACILICRYGPSVIDRIRGKQVES